MSSGEMMSLYAANNIAAAIRGFGKRGYAKLRGLILNAKNIENEESIVREALKEIGTGLVQYIPRPRTFRRPKPAAGLCSRCWMPHLCVGCITSWQTRF